MKEKCTLLPVCYILLMGAAYTQPVLLDDNHTLDGIPLNNRIILSSDIDQTLWSSTGLPGSTVQISPVVVDDDGGSGLLHGHLYFTGVTASEGAELWVTDATPAGTMLVSDIWNGGSSKPNNFITYGNKLYFNAFTPEYGRELYAYSGSGSPVRLTDLNEGAADGFNDPDFYINDSKLYFTGHDGAEQGLYVLANGTISKIYSVPAGFKLLEFSSIGNTVFFQIRNQSTSMALFKTAGTAQSTQLVHEINGLYSGMFPAQMTPFGNRILFAAQTDDYGYELWVTNGINTSQVADINPGGEGSQPQLFFSVILKNKLVFAAYTESKGTELWVTDGTSAGTSMLIDINPVANASSDPFILPAFWDVGGVEGDINRMLSYNGFIFLFAHDGSHGRELWKTDGTPGGTTMVIDLNPGPSEGVNNAAFTYTRSGLIFSGDNGSAGYEPWISDGSERGTRMLADINAAGSSDPEISFIWQGDLYVTANNGNGGVDEYRDFIKLTGPYSPLPVTMTDFTAVVINNNVLLNWRTSSESNSDRFDIMRSENGSSFRNIGSVPAAGQSSSSQRYSYIDSTAQTPQSSALYYRLIIIDKDGRQSMSEIVRVRITQYAPTFSIYPNPVYDLLKVHYSIQEKGWLTISDANGRAMYRSVLKAGGSGMIEIDMSSYPGGMYMIKIADGASTRTEKFFKK